VLAFRLRLSLFARQIAEGSAETHETLHLLARILESTAHHVYSCPQSGSKAPLEHRNVHLRRELTEISGVWSNL